MYKRVRKWNRGGIGGVRRGGDVALVTGVAAVGASAEGHTALLGFEGASTE